MPARPPAGESHLLLLQAVLLLDGVVGLRLLYHRPVPGPVVVAPPPAGYYMGNRKHEHTSHHIHMGHRYRNQSQTITKAGIC